MFAAAVPHGKSAPQGPRPLYSPRVYRSAAPAGLNAMLSAQNFASEPMLVRSMVTQTATVNNPNTAAKLAGGALLVVAATASAFAIAAASPESVLPCPCACARLADAHCSVSSDPSPGDAKLPTCFSSLTAAVAADSCAAVADTSCVYLLRQYVCNTETRDRHRETEREGRGGEEEREAMHNY
jgi:hypothetical protein|eukprot:COSAG03_NODE_2774_length_2459_cov_9.010169_4_plen_183_part_00